MRTVWKYEVPMKEFFELELPAPHKVVRFAEQDSRLHVWIELNPDNPKFKQEFAIVGTGHEIPTNFEHCGSVQQGHYVWHLYRHR